MDYQTSSNSRTIDTTLPRYSKLLLVLFLAVSPLSLFAQTYTGTSTVTITAVVPDPNAPAPTPTPAPSGGGGGGGGGGGVPLSAASGSDTAIFKGLAYPGSVITLIRNGVIAAEVPASPSGTFEIRLRGLNPGTYSFGIRAEDPDKLRSTLDLYTIYVAAAVTTVVDGIFIPPTITTDKVEVKRGDPIILAGRSAPNANVTLTVHSATELIKKITSNSSGSWLYKLDSSELEIGSHEGKVRASTESDLSLYSDPVGFNVGTTNRLRPAGASVALSGKAKCDLNGDSRVNIFDFSIMAFWYKRTGFPAKVDMNADGKINLTDFSIIAYCWTG
jgi:hypothetical protein